MLAYRYWLHISPKFESKYHSFHTGKWIWTYRLQNGGNIVAASYALTHWGRVAHICVGKLIIVGSDNGLSPGRHQAIIWTNAGMLLTGPLGANFSELLIRIQTFSLKKMRFKVSSVKWQPFCLGLNGLKHIPSYTYECITSCAFSYWCNSYNIRRIFIFSSVHCHTPVTAHTGHFHSAVVQ